MNGRDFLATARRLAGGRDEADARSSVSRAYYAAFHAARDRLLSLRFQPPRADRAHKYLYFRLHNCGEARVEDAAGLLDNLRSLRNQADYDVGRSWATDTARDAIADAEIVVLVLDGLTQAELAQITTAMKAYEQTIGDVTWQP